MMSAQTGVLRVQKPQAGPNLWIWKSQPGWKYGAKGGTRSRRWQRSVVVAEPGMRVSW